MKAQTAIQHLKPAGLATQYRYNGDHVVAHETLLHVAEVQKSGAQIYFRPATNMFVTNTSAPFKEFSTFSDAYASENW